MASAPLSIARPPGVDIASGSLQARFLGVEVVVHRAAASRPALIGVTLIPSRSSTRAAAALVLGDKPGCTQPSSISTCRAWRSRGRGASPGGALRGSFSFRCAGQQRAQAPGQFASQALNSVGLRHQRAQTFAQQALADRARHRRVDHGAADVQQVVVVDPGRAGGFAVAARQATVQVLLGLLRDLVALQHLFDQVDAPPWTIQFIAKQLIGRAGGIAEAAVHAGAQDTVGFLGTGQLAGAVAQCGLHGSKLRIQATGVEDAPGIELLLEAAVQAHQRRGQRLERAVGEPVAVAGDMAVDLIDDLGE